MHGAVKLPARWGRGQRTKNSAIYLGVRLAHGVLQALPFLVARRIAIGLGWLAARLDWPDRRRAMTGLAVAFPQLDEAARARIARRMFVHLALSAIEAVHLDRFIRGADRLVLSDAQRAVLDEALSHGKGVMAVTGHIGNWELLAQVVAHAGYPVWTVAKPVYDPRLTRLIHHERSRFGLNVLWRGDAGVAKDMLRVFHQHSVLGLLIDQDTRVQGTFVPFFGRPAYTPTAAAVLALRTGAPIIVGWTHRQGRRHVLHLESLTVADELRAKPDDRAVTQLTAQLTERLEFAIRQAPEQWVWLHQRWKHRPAGEGDSLASETAGLR